MRNDITDGVNATEFTLSASCTRVQAMTFLWHVNGIPKASTTNQFTDVDENAY